MTQWTPSQGVALAAVFDALNASDMDWMVLRNYEGLPNHNPSKDIDIGVAPQNFIAAENLITSVMATHGLTRKQTTVFEWGRCSSYYGVIAGKPLSIKIDLMDGFSWRAAGLFNFEKLNQNTQIYADFPVPNMLNDAAILWLKPLITGGFVKPAYVDRIAQAVADYPDEFRAIVDRLFRKDLADIAWQHLQAGTYDALIPIRKKLAWNAWRREVARAPLAHMGAMGKYVGLELIRRCRRPKGSFVAVLGPDGSGKTTFIDLFERDLAHLQVKDPESIDLEHFRPRIFPNIKALLSKNAPPDVRHAAHVPHQAPPASVPSSALRMTYYWSDYIFGYYARQQRRCVAGRTVIFDRYIYDFLVDPKRCRIRLPRWVVKGFIACTPQPDIVFILSADPEIIFARKQELDQPEIKRQLAEYATLAQSDPDRFVILDAANPPEKSVQTALNTLIEKVY